MTFYCGIDPGSKGALVVIDEHNHLEVFSFKQGMQSAIAFLRANASKCIAAVEDVHAYQGGGASSSFSFGRNLGYIHGMLDTLMIQYIKVQPKTWQKAVTIPPIRMESPRKITVTRFMTPEKKKMTMHQNIEIAKMRAKLKKENRENLKAESIRAANEHLPGLNTKDDNVADAANIAVYLRYTKRLSHL